jgi:hypothetical protein
MNSQTPVQILEKSYGMNRSKRSYGLLLPRSVPIGYEFRCGRFCTGRPTITDSYREDPSWNPISCKKTLTIQYALIGISRFAQDSPPLFRSIHVAPQEFRTRADNAACSSTRWQKTVKTSGNQEALLQVAGHRLNRSYPQCLND